MKKVALLAMFVSSITFAQFQGKRDGVEWIVSRLGLPCDGEINEAARGCFEPPQGAFVHLRSDAIDFDGYRVMLYIRERGGATREVVKYIDREKFNFSTTAAWATINFHDIGRLKTRTIDGTEILFLHVNKVRKTEVSPIVISIPPN